MKEAIFLAKLIEVTMQFKDIVFKEEDYFKLAISVTIETQVKSKIDNEKIKYGLLRCR